jgi:hypothetical protein
MACAVSASDDFSAARPDKPCSQAARRRSGRAGPCDTSNDGEEQRMNNEGFFGGRRSVRSKSDGPHAAMSSSGSGLINAGADQNGWQRGRGWAKPQHKAKRQME